MERKVFVGVVVKKDQRVLSLTIDGRLQQFNKQGEMLKWMFIKVERAFTCNLIDDMLVCACNNGLVRMFDVRDDNFTHVANLSKPPPLGASNINANQVSMQNKKVLYADAVACAVDQKSQKILI